MAKKKISGLPASGALTGTEIVPIVQSGTTKRTTTQDIADLGGGGGGISGSGTANFVSKWSDGTTLTDSLFFSDDNIAKTIWDTTDKGLYFDFSANQYYIGDTDRGLFVDLNNSFFALGDNGYNNSTYFSIDDDNQIIKTSSGGSDKGLVLDFASNTYSLGDPNFTYDGTALIVNDNNAIINSVWENTNIGLYINYPNNIYGLGYTETGDFVNDNVIGFSAKGYVFQMGEAGGIANKTYFEVDDTNQIIKTSNNFADKGLNINFGETLYSLGLGDGDPYIISGFSKIGQSYYMGDNANLNNSNLISVLDNDLIIKTSSQGSDKGLYLDFANNYHYLGSLEQGLKIQLNDHLFYLGDYGGTLNNTHIIVNDNDDNYRITLNAKRTKLQNWSQEDIQGFTDPQAGDISYDATENEIVYYNGSSWQRLNHGPM